MDWANSSLVQTVCRCNHLTNFGLLFDINGALGDWDAVQMEILSILSIVLMSLSIVASTLTFIILQLSRCLAFYDASKLSNYSKVTVKSKNCHCQE